MAINFAAANTAGLNNPGAEIITLVKDGSGNFINPPSYDKMRAYLRGGEVPMLFVTTEARETGSLYQLAEYSETQNKIRFGNDANTIEFVAGAAAPVVSDVGGGGSEYDFIIRETVSGEVMLDVLEKGTYASIMEKLGTQPISGKLISVVDDGAQKSDYSITLVEYVNSTLKVYTPITTDSVTTLSCLIINPDNTITVVA